MAKRRKTKKTERPLRPPMQLVADSTLTGYREGFSEDSSEVQLLALRILRETLDVAIEDHVRAMRERGDSWSIIGVALGVSRQAAWERYERLESSTG